MLKDIPKLIVEDVAIAMVKEMNPSNEPIWNAYLLNFKEHAIASVLVTSNGYGDRNGEAVKTSTLRHFLDTIPAKSFRLIEPLIEDVFEITNQFWLSFYEKGQIYDKKYIFLPETICSENLIYIPMLKADGVLIL